MNTNGQIERHYGSAGIADRILAALRGVIGPDAPVTPEALAPLDHFHGGGLAATRALLAALAPQAGEHLLDIGCGIGGPARWTASTFGCHVTGIDLTKDFCDAAEALTQACGLGEAVRIVHASATDLPLPDASFDRAWSHNVAMNIPNKPRFYAEAFRVLRPGGTFAVAQVTMGPNGPPTYPQPWARVADTSFLPEPEQVRADAVAAGFDVLAFSPGANRGPAGSGGGAPPVLGIHVLMGDFIREARRNGVADTASGRMGTLTCLLRKPA